ncbi:MAG: UDP-glucuronic acid decarboxylase family protein [Candidatus Dormibacteria bacterium]
MSEPLTSESLVAGRAVVTGGAGFLGAHLCRRMLALGCQVLCIDNLSTGTRANLADLEPERAFSFLQRDVSLPLEVDGRVDYVLHFASPASPEHYLRLPLETLRVGTRGTEHTLDLALVKGARYLVASTSEVYGDPQVHPQPESYWGHVNSVGPRSVYDEAKRASEAFTMAYHRARGVDTRIVRIFNTYGPGMDPADGRAIPNFATQALRGEPITVYGDGSQTRSLCYVDDLVEGILRLLASFETMPVNIGNQEEVSMLELAESVRAATRSSSEIVFRPLPQDDPLQRRPDTTRAREILGWEARVPLSQGLPPTIEAFRARLTGASA